MKGGRAMLGTRFGSCPRRCRAARGLLPIERCPYRSLSANRASYLEAMGGLDPKGRKLEPRFTRMSQKDNLADASGIQVRVRVTNLECRARQRIVCSSAARIYARVEIRARPLPKQTATPLMDGSGELCWRDAFLSAIGGFWGSGCKPDVPRIRRRAGHVAHIGHDGHVCRPLDGNPL